MTQLALVDEGRAAPDGVGLTSWATSNEEMFARILALYARPGMSIADVTYGKGVFWRLVDTSVYDFRPSDLSNGIDARRLPYRNDELDMLVFDPPYRYVERRTQAGHTHEQYRLESVRQTERPGIDGVLDLYRDGITEAGRVVKRGGFLVVKCQDTGGDGKQTWTHDHIMGYCVDAGFTPVDFAVVVTASPPPTRWKIQRRLRKAHSYFVVARKGGFFPFGYRAVQARSETSGLTPGEKPCS